MKAFVAGAAVVAVAFFSLLAVWRAVRAWSAVAAQGDDRTPDDDIERTYLLDEKLRHLKSLKEIEFDHQTGKIDDVDFGKLKERHEAGAASAIRALDTLDAGDERAS